MNHKNQEFALPMREIPKEKIHSYYHRGLNHNKKKTFFYKLIKFLTA